MPPSWQLDREMRLFAADHGIADPDAEFEKFKDFHLARGNTFKDWCAAWRNWVRNAKKFDRGANETKQQRQSFGERNIARAHEELDELNRRAHVVLQKMGSGISESSDRKRLPDGVPRGLERSDAFTN